MIYFTSDLHFGHYNVITYCNRPFQTVEQMNEAMVVAWNSVVKPEDTVYVLGDCALNKKYVAMYGPKLNGTKHLIVGNHDDCHPMRYKNNAEKGQRMRKFYYDAGFTSIQVEMKMEIAGHSVKLHHMPYKNDHTAEERFKELRPKDEGDWLLHGHVHTMWKIRGREINVGVDVWNFLPIPITEIERIINEHNKS